MSVSKVASRKRKRNTWIELTSEKLEKALNFLPWVGYLLLILTFLDYAFLLIPPNFFNPSWELNIIGSFVENVWAPLLGFLLIFSRPTGTKIKGKELKLLTWLSRLILALAVFYFLTVPLIISNTIRMQSRYFSEFKVQVEEQKIKADNLEQQLNKLPEDQLKVLFQENQGGQGFSPSIDTSQPLRKQLLNQLKHERQKGFKQVETAYKKQKMNLLKNIVKWNISAIISGVLFVILWRYTSWVRTSPRKNHKMHPENS
jgi:hypothetical protein